MYRKDPPVTDSNPASLSERLLDVPVDNRATNDSSNEKPFCGIAILSFIGLGFYKSFAAFVNYNDHKEIGSAQGENDAFYLIILGLIILLPAAMQPWGF